MIAKLSVYKTKLFMIMTDSNDVELHLLLFASAAEARARERPVHATNTVCVGQTEED